ncbi:MAG: LPS export ABC transporter periplasmic protein LptC [Candidatus Omnitrophota bacterium]|nr:MAG: LPS export ABC transporter periplasmic protein LptC [Candidatus Omnitrophota bacterium]
MKENISSGRILIFVCIVSLLVSGCAREDKVEVKRELEEAPDEMLSVFSLSGYTKGGKKEWDLEGKSADISLEEIKLKDVTAKLYGKDTNMTIVADKGSLNRLNNSVHLEKDVVVTSDDGATLTTDYLDWDAEAQRLASEAPVWIKRGMMEAAGIGITAQPVLNQVELKKDVTVKMSLGTTITCKGVLAVDYQKNLAIFQDNVKVKDKRGEIFADKMDICFATQNEEEKQLEGMEGMGIEKVTAVGSVQIHRADNITYSERAVYDTNEGRLTLTGQPKLVIYSTKDFSQLMAGE